ncbi:urease subunit beta [Paenibacillus endoradicis]|uniref:urease subunit beta n=1 Tax=Paenibacillus endoradicis TaxID=2972487 RepID=UPI002159A5BD|nr:urease subunit beta [Paenibacillus endoradicis]MCR8659795.1 urease subunit beta [Paenibacillus endoradicis]
MHPGEYVLREDDIICNENRNTHVIEVVNIGDRPVQVGSHYHFYEVNNALQFIREEAYGMRLDIPAGSAVRFEPGDAKQVNLVALAGERRVYGLNNQTNGYLDK